MSRAKWRYTTGARALDEIGDTKEAVRDFASAAELALKAVYIRLGRSFPRTHDVSRLVEGCPDQTARSAIDEYSERFVKEFSRNYRAPYVLARPVPLAAVEDCRRFSLKILEWAENVATG